MFGETGPSAEQREVAAAEPDQADLERNLALLEDAQVELEVRLQGPTLAVTELLALQAGHVITFDYSLHKSLHGLLNGDLAVMGHIVTAGRKRAFQVEQLTRRTGSISLSRLGTELARAARGPDVFHRCKMSCYSANATLSSVCFFRAPPSQPRMVFATACTISIRSCSNTGKLEWSATAT